MAGSGFELTNSFLEEFDMTFHPYLKQRGSQLMQACVQEPVQGAVKYVRFQNVGDAHWVTSHGDPTNYTTIEYDRRRLKPVGLECAITLDAYDMVQQGTPDPGMLAQQAANACGRKIDELIIQGINGTAYTESQGEVVLSGAESVTAGADPRALVANYDKTQTIAWNDATACGNIDENPLMTNAGLSTSKLAKAVKKLRKANNQVGPFICITDAHGMLSARADKRAAAAGTANSIKEILPSKLWGSTIYQQLCAAAPYKPIDAFKDYKDNEYGVLYLKSTAKNNAAIPGTIVSIDWVDPSPSETPKINKTINILNAREAA